MSLTQLPHEAGFLRLHLFEVVLLAVRCLAIKQNVAGSIKHSLIASKIFLAGYLFRVFSMKVANVT